MTSCEFVCRDIVTAIYNNALPGTSVVIHKSLKAITMNRKMIKIKFPTTLIFWKAPGISDYNIKGGEEILTFIYYSSK